MKKMTRDEAIELHQACEELIKSPKMRFKHLYAVTKNMNYTRPIKKQSENNIAISAEYYAFTNEVQQAVAKYAQKQPNKDVMMLGADGYPVFKTKEMEAKAIKAIKDLREKYKDAIEQQKEKDINRDAFMSEEVEVEIYELLNEVDISDVTLSELVKTRRIYRMVMQGLEKKSMKKEDIITTIIYAKNEQSLLPYTIKMLVLHNMIQLTPVIDEIITDPRYKNFYQIYDAGINRIKEIYGKRDLYGELYMRTDQKGERVIVLEDPAKYNEALEAYKSENAKYLDDFDALRTEVVEVEVAMLTPDMLKTLEEMPEISNNGFQVLYPFIKEE